MPRKKMITTPAEQVPPGLTLHREIAGNGGEIVQVEWSPDGRFIVSPSDDGTIYVWDSHTGKPVHKMKGGIERRNCVSWSPNGDLIASGSTNSSILLWDADQEEPVKTLTGHEDKVFSVAWSPDGFILASGGDDRAVRLWDIREGKQLYTFTGHSARVYSVAWAPRQPIIASCGDDRTIRLWDVGTGNALRTLRGHRDYVYSVVWSPDARIIASASMDQTIQLWDPFTGSKIRVLEGHEGLVRWLSFSSDGRILASKSADGTIKLWRYDAGEVIAVINEPTVGRWPSSFEFHPTDSVLATLGNNDRIIRIWNVDVDLLLSTAPVLSRSHYTNAKVVLVGETSTGKTCLMRALMGKSFKPQESTHGIKVWTFHSETTEQDDGGQVTRETLLWDLAGQVDYQVVHQLFLDETALGIVMFDPTHPENPFAGVGHWEKALTRVAGKDCSRLLVAGRVDRGYPTATAEDIETFRRQHGYQQFIATSAKTDQGVDEVREAIRRSIPWERLPVTSSPELWKQIREYLFERRAGEEVLTRRGDLREAFRQKHPDAEFTEAEFNTVIRHAQAQGLLWRLSFGDFVLLKPELLNDYAAAIVRAARRQLEGLGCVAEQNVLDDKIDFEDLGRLEDTEIERSLLHAVVQLVQERELALRESGQLVFPSKFNRQHPDIPEPQPREVTYLFTGSVEEIYTTLVVRLFYSGAFTMKELWKNAAEFHDSLDNICGFTLDSSAEGQGVISIFFTDDTPDSSKVLFLRFIHEHLHQRSLSESVYRERIYRCPQCGEEVQNRRAVEVRLSKGKTTILCQFCEGSIDLVDTLETKFGDPELLRQIREMEARVADKKSQAVGVTVAGAKRSVGEYDVFLAHNSADKPQVEIIAQVLRQRGLNPWLDKEQIPPGRWFQDLIQQAIREVKSVAILVGPQGLGRWQIVELRSFISQCIEREIPVIPVLLPGVTKISKDIVFLSEFNLVQFSNDIDDVESLDNLEWGITGEHPRRRKE